jgi:hypothetical protein
MANVRRMWRGHGWAVAALAVATMACDGSSGSATPDAGPPPRPVPHPRDDTLRMNHLQAKGTHNSYHVETTNGTLVDWNYTHAPLAEQLDEQGVRKFELDVWYDALLDTHEVLHLPALDPGTVCDTLIECLEDIKGWSDYHPGHHPLFVQIEPKDQGSNDPEVVTERMEWVEQDILSVFPEERIITPDEVRGGADSLAEALDAQGWPTLGQARGRILFFLDCHRDHCVDYAHGGTGLDGRLIFAASQEGDPFDAVRVINNPESQLEQIQDAVMAGRIVRTMVDNVLRALDNDTTRLEAGLESGAHMLSSDVPVPRDDTEYVMEIPGGTPSRCNPISAPPDCVSTDLEDPDLLTGE